MPYEQYKPPFITEDMSVTMSMLKHGIMPDKADIDVLAEALAKALKDNLIPTVSIPTEKNPPCP